MRASFFYPTYIRESPIYHPPRIRTHGSALKPHSNVYATGSETQNDEMWPYLRDRDYLASRVYLTSPKRGQGTTNTSQPPFTATYSAARITSGSSAPSQLYPGGTDRTCLTTSNQRGRGGRAYRFRARGRRKHRYHCSSNATTNNQY